MKLRKSEIISLIIIIISAIIGIYFYPRLPEKIASHWNTQGEVNGYMPKFWGVFLMPMISAVMWLIFLIIPKIDPKKENIEKFRKYFDRFIILLFLFLLYIYILTLYWNLGNQFDFIRFLLPVFAILFYFTGDLISKSEMNWTIGIRTPWTLSSETVWKKTHTLGGKLFKASAIITLVGLFFPSIAFWFTIIPVIIFSIFIIAYSYFAFRKEKAGNK